jgi:hypothetical protein
MFNLSLGPLVAALRHQVPASDELSAALRIEVSVSHDCITPNFLANFSKSTLGSMTPLRQ